MVAVREIPWEEASAPAFENPTRKTWRQAVSEIADKAKAKLPECSGRVDKAVALVLNGDVALFPDGTARVASQSNGTDSYHVVNGHCDCRDYEKAPHNFCKHRLSAAIARRAQELVKAKLADTTGQELAQSQKVPAPTAPLPEAPASVNVHLELNGRTVQLTLRDADEGRLLQRLEAVLQRFPLVVKPTETQARPEGWCRKHNVPMKLNQKAGRSWWSHKTAEGWCQDK